MGEEIQTSSFSDSDFDRFKKKLEEETRLLESWFKEKKFSIGSNRAGYELEAWLIDEQLNPASINEAFLEKLDSPLASPELASFNVEVNSTPCDLHGDVLSRMQQELDVTWVKCKRAAHELSSDIVMAGILPTLDNEVLHLANMSKMKRYRALNREVMHRRKGKPMAFDINGIEHLKVIHRDVMMEAAATSFQIHLQVNLENAVRMYNASVAITGPLLALSVNSPYLFGKDLWDETRIPVFEQSVAVGGYDGAAFGPIRRVTFGNGYVRESLFECFQENLEHYPVLLPVEFEHDEPLAHLRLHNGTIWRWNRPLIGFNEKGEPHLRIEQRVVPSGPTTQDAIANAAFYYGAVTALAQLDDPIENQLPHSSARDNFYAAARLGLKSTQRWINNQDINARELILDTLLPLAYQGLTSLGVDYEDIDKYLGIIHARVKSGQNGANWQRAFVKKHGRDMKKLTHAYIRNQNTGEPVHHWHLQSLDTAASRLTVLDEIPEGLLNVPATDLHEHLQGPTLIRLKGRRDDVLFVSVLLHGNETTGWDAVREILASGDELPRGLYLFIGNVAAAAQGLRHLNGQVDFNRIWKLGTKTPESAMADQLLAELQQAPLFAALDIHNNTGMNPHYACINKLQREFFHLATLFSRTVVFFTSPDSVMSRALSELCPSTTLECGKAGDKHGTEHAHEFINACLHLQAFPEHDVAEHDIDVFHTVATVKIPDDVEFDIDNPDADNLKVKLNFIADMDRLNFQELEAGTVLGHVNCGKSPCLQAINEEGNDVARQYFTTEKGILRFAVPLMPSMITLDKDIIRSDCLCYLMERLDYHNLKQDL